VKKAITHLKLDQANPGKLERLDELATEYQRILQAYVDRLTQGVFDANKDFLPLFGEGDSLTLQNGSFALLLPQDAHLPGIANQSPAPVKKNRH